MTSDAYNPHSSMFVSRAPSMYRAFAPSMYCVPHGVFIRGRELRFVHGYGRYNVRKFLSDKNRVYRSVDLKIEGGGQQRCKNTGEPWSGGPRLGIAAEGLRQRDLRFHACHESVVVPRL